MSRKVRRNEGGKSKSGSENLIWGMFGEETIGQWGKRTRNLERGNAEGWIKSKDGIKGVESSAMGEKGQLPWSDKKERKREKWVEEKEW